MIALLRQVAAASIAVAALGLGSGCTTESYCFEDCEGDGTGGASDGGGSGGSGGGFNPSGGSGGGIFMPGSGGSDGGECSVAEICNGADDDCDGEIDEDIDFEDPRQCGNCATNCYAAFPVGVEPDGIACTPPPSDRLGIDPGTCAFAQCAQDFWDVDGDLATGCEYFCQDNPDGTTTVDLGGTNGCGRDDDCDGETDEDVDLCADVDNCGRCGKRCSIPNGTGRCVTDAEAGEPCIEDNTGCEVDQCDADFWDADGVGSNGCEYACEQSGPEICDGIDNDCDGLIDNADPDLSGEEPEIGTECFGGSQGICGAAANAGFFKCIGTDIVCCDKDSNNVPSPNPNFPDTGLQNGVCEGQAGPFVVEPGDVAETCNGDDDDCDGSVDEGTDGGSCGSSVGSCKPGTNQCQNGEFVCVGATLPTEQDVCDGQDNNCDGVIDGKLPETGLPVSCTTDTDCTGGLVCRTRNGPTDRVCVQLPSDTGTACGVPPPAPCVNSAGAVVDCSAAGATPVPQPCNAGALTCVGGAKVCIGDQGPLVTQDACGEDSNCNGSLDNQPDLQASIANCGSCGNDCRTGGAHVVWTCDDGTCAPDTTNKCEAGYLDCDSNPNDCETACIPSGAELCNNFDDDCDCEVDESPAVPTAIQVCGVAQTASEAGCTTGVTVSCEDGAWTCSFPNGYCTGGNCPATTDRCDGIDNNCNGTVDDGFVVPFRGTRAKGQPCFSDDGLPPPGHGACRGEATYVCNAQGTDTTCPAQFDADEAGPELCNGEDDDCDSVIDEMFEDAAATDGNFVRPEVVNIGGGVYMFRYEASRPSAEQSTPGSGNGYHTSAPAGTTLDSTIACSVEDKIPWFNVTPDEVEQTCAAIGGRACTLANWQTACHASASCDWGYGPAPACTSPADYDDGPFCNLHGFDFDPSTPAVIDDGLLPTGSDDLDTCFANVGTGIFDITGNLREITRTGSNYVLTGGAFNSHSEDGASCEFDFFSVTEEFRLFDTGFRCCFDENPSAP